MPDRPEKAGQFETSSEALCIDICSSSNGLLPLGHHNGKIRGPLLNAPHHPEELCGAPLEAAQHPEELCTIDRS